MREAERHRCGLAATADLGRPGRAPNSPQASGSVLVWTLGPSFAAGESEHSLALDADTIR